MTTCTDCNNLTTHCECGLFRSSARTSGRATPNVVPATVAIQSYCEAGNWTLISPDGRVWVDPAPGNLLHVLAVNEWHKRFEPAPPVRKDELPDA